MGYKKRQLSNGGYALLAAIIAVNIFAIMLFKAREIWETKLQRDLELELLFRARQYVYAIEAFKQKNVNTNPKSLDELYDKKFLRKRFKDPMTTEGKWNIVMREGRAGKKGLLIVPEEMLEQYIGRGSVVGVCSMSPEEGFLEYRKKKRYNEWAVYMGEKVEKEMPELKFVAEGEGADEDNDSSLNKPDANPTDDNGRSLSR